MSGPPAGHAALEDRGALGLDRLEPTPERLGFDHAASDGPVQLAVLVNDGPRAHLARGGTVGFDHRGHRDPAARIEEGSDDAEDLTGWHIPAHADALGPAVGAHGGGSCRGIVGRWRVHALVAGTLPRGGGGRQRGANGVKH
ncbi:MAG: hypothetical protein M5U12_29375 [Verrucomicrobia bacterium]|nr:hypothetical protein [Verrucomicrobiota bacterium]